MNQCVTTINPQSENKKTILRNSFLNSEKNNINFVLLFYSRHYKLLTLLFNVIMPVFVPWHFWNESILNAFMICFALRYVVTLNATWCVNSLAHLLGSKPYDKSINPSENFSVVLMTGGEGFHNFHHTFPQDYATSELGMSLNPSKWIIDICAMLGLAYDLKTTSPDMVLKRRMRTGDMQQLNHHHDWQGIQSFQQKKRVINYY